MKPAAGQVTIIKRNARQRMDGVCRLEGCERPQYVVAEGICRRHYYRLKRYGDPVHARPRQAPNNLTHGHTANGQMSREYNSWAMMTQRCTNDKNHKFKDYGGRGIKVCLRWRKFENFLADMGPRPANTTIHRIENDGDYQPGNCKWATSAEQAANKRKKSSHRPESCGENHHSSKLTVTDVRAIRSRGGENQRKLAAEFGVHQAVISSIIHRKTWKHV